MTDGALKGTIPGDNNDENIETDTPMISSLASELTTTTS